jgi:phage-related protein
LRFQHRTKTEMESVRDFFMGKYGALTSFTWTNPNDSVEYTVRFVEDSFKFVLKAYQVYDFEFDFIEVK